MAASRRPSRLPASVVVLTGMPVAVSAGQPLSARLSVSQLTGQPLAGSTRAIDAVGAVLVQVVLHRRREPACADEGVDLGVGPDIAQDHAGGVLALGGEAIGQARPGPVGAGVIRQEEPCLGSHHQVVAVVGINPHLADGLVLREVVRRLGVGWVEDVGAEDRPGGALVGALEHTGRAEGEGAKAQVARAGVDRVVVVGVDEEVADRDGAQQRVVGDGCPGRAGGAAVGGLPDTAAVRAQVGHIGRYRVD